ncbi:multidrug ABC transporter ATP-binding protein [Alphaproteobacteria bacterium]|nr:multidrug ABC transporter ATP-binding protein [Alphaproteobacteria bacterium]
MNKIAVVENLNVIFGNFYAVKNVSFSVDKGEIFGFLGSNGAGKTTTIRVLCGLLPATSGNVIIDGTKFTAGLENIIKRKVGYMSQKFTLYDDLTIEENLEFSACLRDMDSSTYEDKKSQLLKFIDFKNDTNQIVGNLSGGIKQEIALVTSILHDPKIIFLDEPTAGVAPAMRDKFWNLIKKLSESGKTIFVTTHYMDEAENCHRIALMRSGELIALDTPGNLKKTTYNKPMYLLTAHDAESRKYLVDNSQDFFEMFAPYGLHYHAIISEMLDEDQTLDNMKKYCTFQKISPSLEDVFIKLVEGDR